MKVSTMVSVPADRVGFHSTLFVGLLVVFLLGLLTGILYPPTLVAQDCVEYADYFHWVNSLDTDWVYDIVVYGDYLYAAVASGDIEVIDISNNAFPEFVTRIDAFENARGLAIDDDYLYVAAYATGLIIYDLANPAEPNRVSIESLYCSPYAVDVQWPVAYVTGAGRELQLVNIVDPTNPIDLGYLDLAGTGKDIIIDGYYAYVAVGDSGLKVIQIVSSNDLVQVGQMGVPGGAWGLAMYGDLLYIAAGGGLRIVDVSNPPDPQLQGSSTEIYDLVDVTVTSTQAFTASTSRGVQSYNVSDPTNPQLIGNVGLKYGANCLARPFSYLYLYAGGPEALHVLDKYPAASPPLIGELDPAGNLTDLVSRGNYVYGAAGNSGLQVIDIANPAAPFLAGSAPTSGYARSVAAAGSHVYVAAGGAGLDVFDLTDPSVPSGVATYDPAGFVATAVAVIGDLAYIADGNFGLRVIDISDPANPTQIGGEQIAGGILWIAVVGDYAYCNSWGYGLHVVDVSYPSAPALVGDLYFFGEILRLDANDNDYVYMACDYDGLQIADVSDPTNPQYIAEITTLESPRDVRAAGSYVYVADHVNGVQVFEMSSPANPDLVGSFATESAIALFANADHIYISDFFGELRIAPAQCGAVDVEVGVPEHPDLALTVYPNPFNPLTKIAFTMPVGGQAQIAIYDLGGRRVKTLAKREFAAGAHTLSWDGRNERGRALPSGSYLLRLKTEAGSDARKVMLVR